MAGEVAGPAAAAAARGRRAGAGVVAAAVQATAAVGVAVSAAAARREAGREDMGIKRISRHLLQYRWRERREFPPRVLAAIEAAIKAGEATHSGEVRFVVE